MNILVTDGENRSSLAVTRSLGRRGCRVIVTGTEKQNLASSSRYCHGNFITPNPLHEGHEYVRAVTEIAGRENIDIVFPMTESSIFQLNPFRSELPLLACELQQKVETISNKAALCRLAEKLGVGIPSSLYLDSCDNLADVIENIENYPVVIKPFFSKISEGAGYLSAGVKYAHSKKELENLYATNRALKYPSMIQEKIEGPGTGLFTLFDNDRHLALFSHQRLREKPPSGGVSVVSQSLALDEEMVEASRRLLSAVGWQGVAMVEFKRDLRDGRVKLMEINGRFWGSLQLAIACGVDFPALLLDYLQGKIPQVCNANYRVGKKLKWFFGTLDHLLIRLKNRPESLNLPMNAPSRWGAMVEFLKIWERNTSFDVFDRGDLWPFWFETRGYIKQTLRSKGAV